MKRSFMKRPSRIWHHRRWWMNQRSVWLWNAYFRGCINFDSHFTWRDA
jgi:hypothetical protein